MTKQDALINYNNGGRKCCIPRWKDQIPVIFVPVVRDKPYGNKVVTPPDYNDESLQILRRYAELGTQGSKAD